MGLRDKLKGAFGGSKKEDLFESPRESYVEKRPEAPVAEDEAGSRYMQARKWREDMEMRKPLIERRKP